MIRSPEAGELRADLAYFDVTTIPEMVVHMSETNILPIPELKLELVPVPVSNLDRAKAFYAELLGFHVDHDVQPSDTVRVIQLTPAGSACSILLGAGLPGVEMPPGSLRGLHLVVTDINKAREALVNRGVEVSAIVDQGGIKYASFSDPDGNTWALQEMPTP